MSQGLQAVWPRRGSASQCLGPRAPRRGTMSQGLRAAIFPPATSLVETNGHEGPAAISAGKKACRTCSHQCGQEGRLALGRWLLGVDGGFPGCGQTKDCSQGGGDGAASARCVEAVCGTLERRGLSASGGAVGSRWWGVSRLHLLHNGKALPLNYESEGVSRYYNFNINYNMFILVNNTNIAPAVLLQSFFMCRQLPPCRAL